MDRNPENPKIFFLQHREENIGEMKIPWHKSHHVFQRGPVHESIRNITVFNPDPGCRKSEKRNKARYPKSSPAVVSGLSPAVNNFLLRGLVHKPFKINSVALSVRINLEYPFGSFF